jgi:hypothetical protein
MTTTTLGRVDLSLGTNLRVFVDAGMETTYTGKWMDIVLFMFVLLSTGGKALGLRFGGFLFVLDKC